MVDQVGLNLSNAMADAVEQAAGSIVLVDARRRFPLSGLAYAADLVLTADHGVEREENIRLLLPDGREAQAELAGRDKSSDLALLRLSEARLTPAQAAARPARVGNLVLAVGRPSSEGVQASLGLVNAVGGQIHTHRGRSIESYIAADATPYPGFSGGPLVDLGGGVLGINTSGLVQGMSLAIPLNAAWRVAESLSKHGHVRRGYLGIRSQPVEIPTQARQSLGREQTTGLLIVGVEPDGPAAQALMVGDILVGAAGAPVATHDDLMAALSGDAVGKSTRLDVLRGGNLKQVDVTVGERA